MPGGSNPFESLCNCKYYVVGIDWSYLPHVARTASTVLVSIGELPHNLEAHNDFASKRVLNLEFFAQIFKTGTICISLAGINGHTGHER
jgi:hypothetical protein